jgi:ppGpp synthetase/RelA/SpoT-type nucleotidyltranferase
VATIYQLEQEYKANFIVAEQFADEISHQLNHLLENEHISLSFPIQHRVKTWISIAEKLEHKSLSLLKLTELSDLIGLRIILQFKRDVDKVCRLISSNFTVLEQYDTQERLKENEFGYSSIHFVITLPESWLAIPTLSHMQGLRAEIQVRTTAQHIWASASHLLQYKNEKSIPPSIRRTIHRVSALLETVDLEFERVLEQREVYREGFDHSLSSEHLNVDLLEHALDSMLPAENKDRGVEKYAELLNDLAYFDIKTLQDLRDLIGNNLEEIQKRDAAIVKLIKENKKAATKFKVDPERNSRGVFYNHTGLIRDALEIEFGKNWRDYIIKARTKG